MDSYAISELGQLLSANPYPGRGIVVGQSKNGRYAAVAYFIMGRSENSRNRRFEKNDDGIRTRAVDESKLTDPSLIIYYPVRRLGNQLIVTNGDQTDTIRAGLLEGKSFAQALRSRQFEPDGPNWTARISALLDFREGGFSYEMSILKSADAAGKACNRFTFSYEPLPGLGHFLHTYATDGDPLPTFQGEPERVAVGDDAQAFTREIWESLNGENKISLYTSWTDLATGEEHVQIINKHQNA
jgi:hypothetical protein